MESMPIKCLGGVLVSVSFCSLSTRITLFREAVPQLVLIVDTYRYLKGLCF